MTITWDGSATQRPFPKLSAASRLLITPQSSSSNALLSGMFSSPPSGLPLAQVPPPGFLWGPRPLSQLSPSRHDLLIPPETLPGLWRSLWEPDEAQGMGSSKVTLCPRQLGLESCSAQGNSPPAESCGEKGTGRRSSTLSCPQTCPFCSQNLCILRTLGKSHNL